MLFPREDSVTTGEALRTLCAQYCGTRPVGSTCAVSANVATAVSSERLRLNVVLIDGTWSQVSGEAGLVD